MKVLILHPPLYPVNHKLFNELGELCDLTVLSFGNHPGLHSNWLVKDFIRPENSYKLLIKEGKTNLNRYSVSYRLQFSPFFLKYIISEKPDVVISVAFWMPSLYMALFKKILKTKLVILTDAIPITEMNLSTIKKRVRKIISKKTDCFLAGSDLTISYLKSISKDEGKIKKSIQTIDVDEWKSKLPKLDTKEKLRLKYGYEIEKKILLSIGHFNELKNLNSIINEIKDLNNVLLILVGEGEQKDLFIETAKNNGVIDKLILIDRIEGVKLMEYYKLSDIFIFPTKRDTFGFVVCEALVSGLPVICSINSGASSLINNGENGYLIDPNEEYGMIIEKTIFRLHEMSVKAKLSMDNFTIKNKAHNLYNILNDL
jgi:glycosyltransferase involved in cell wall biosynthesis